MLEFKPVEKKELVDLMVKNDISNAVNCIAYGARENGGECGFCIASVNSNYADILALDYPQDRLYVGDGLIRSTLNFAAGMGAYMARSTLREYGELFGQLNFGYESEEYIGEIPEILKGSCCSHK